MRFKAYNWHVQNVTDGNDTEAIFKALETAKAETGQPSLVVMRTNIAYGSPNKQDSADAHGAPLGEEEIRLTKKNLNWPDDVEFFVPDEVINSFRNSVET